MSSPRGLQCVRVWCGTAVRAGNSVRLHSKSIFVPMRCSRRQTIGYSRILLAAAFFWAFATSEAQQPDRCAELNNLKVSSVEITKAELIAEGTTIPPPYPGAPPI